VAAHAALQVHCGAAERVVDLNRRRGDHLVQQNGRAPADLRRTADLGLRIENLLRSRNLRATWRSAIRQSHRDQDHDGRDSYLSLQMVPYGEGQQLLLVGDVSRQMRLEAMRKDFVANASTSCARTLTVISGYLET